MTERLNRGQFPQFEVETEKNNEEKEVYKLLETYENILNRFCNILDQVDPTGSKCVDISLVPQYISLPQKQEYYNENTSDKYDKNPDQNSQEIPNSYQTFSGSRGKLFDEGAAVESVEHRESVTIRSDGPSKTNFLPVPELVSLLPTVASAVVGLVQDLKTSDNDDTPTKHRLEVPQQSFYQQQPYPVHGFDVPGGFYQSPYYVYGPGPYQLQTPTYILRPVLAAQYPYQPQQLPGQVQTAPYGYQQGIYQPQPQLGQIPLPQDIYQPQCSPQQILTIPSDQGAYQLQTQRGQIPPPLDFYQPELSPGQIPTIYSEQSAYQPQTQQGQIPPPQDFYQTQSSAGQMLTIPPGQGAYQQKFSPGKPLTVSPLPVFHRQPQSQQGQLHPPQHFYQLFSPGQILPMPRTQDSYQPRPAQDLLPTTPTTQSQYQSRSGTIPPAQGPYKSQTPLSQIPTISQPEPIKLPCQGTKVPRHQFQTLPGKIPPMPNSELGPSQPQTTPRQGENVPVRSQIPTYETQNSREGQSDSEGKKYLPLSPVEGFPSGPETLHLSSASANPTAAVVNDSPKIEQNTHSKLSGNTTLPSKSPMPDPASSATRTSFPSYSPTLTRSPSLGLAPSPTRSSFHGCSPTPTRSPVLGLAPSPTRSFFHGRSPTPTRSPGLGIAPSPTRSSFHGCSPTPTRSPVLGLAPSPTRSSFPGRPPTPTRPPVLGLAPSPTRSSFHGRSPTLTRSRNLGLSFSPTRSSFHGHSWTPTRLVDRSSSLSVPSSSYSGRSLYYTGSNLPVLSHSPGTSPTAYNKVIIEVEKSLRDIDDQINLMLKGLESGKHDFDQGFI